MSNRHVKRSIVLRVTDNRRVSYHQITFDPGEIIRHDSVGGAQWVNLKELMLIPKTIREVERHLLLLETGRAVLVLRQWPSATYYLGLYQALSLLARLLRKGHLGKAMVAHVLTMLGGPMERMESWGPPGRNKRRPCKVRVCYPDGRNSSGEREYLVYTALLGGVKNYHATD